MADHLTYRSKSKFTLKLFPGANTLFRVFPKISICLENLDLVLRGVVSSRYPNPSPPAPIITHKTNCFTNFGILASFTKYEENYEMEARIRLIGIRDLQLLPLCHTRPNRFLQTDNCLCKQVVCLIS